MKTSYNIMNCIEKNYKTNELNSYLPHIPQPSSHGKTKYNKFEI